MKALVVFAEHRWRVCPASAPLRPPSQGVVCQRPSAARASLPATPIAHGRRCLGPSEGVVAPGARRCSLARPVLPRSARAGAGAAGRFGPSQVWEEAQRWSTSSSRGLAQLSTDQAVADYGAPRPLRSAAGRRGRGWDWVIGSRNRRQGPRAESQLRSVSPGPGSCHGHAPSESSCWCSTRWESSLLVLCQWCCPRAVPRGRPPDLLAAAQPLGGGLAPAR